MNCQLLLLTLIWSGASHPGGGSQESPPAPLVDPLSRDDSEQVADQLWADRAARIQRDHQPAWDAREIRIDDRTMKFAFRTFGEPSPSGRSLYISMHGGGGAPAAVNDRQWQNQIRLYRPAEGIYLAPRAPTNTWNLWHEPHIDRFFQRLINDAVLLEGVDPNRVYLTGYSAGGDGVYQLAPRMADRWAAAAMMAGHPNNASPLGLRNIAFTIHMGGDDSAFNRNGVAANWKQTLAELRKDDPDGYLHEVHIHDGLGHWMNGRDADAIPWMAERTRNPWPRRVVWHQSPVTHGQFYWLAVDPDNQRGGSTVIAESQGQTVRVVEANGIDRLEILLNDRMMDLDQPVRVEFGDRVLFEGLLRRTRDNLELTLAQRGDRCFMFPARVIVDVGP